MIKYILNNSPSRLAHHFEMVQSIRYKIQPYNPAEIDEYLPHGDCRHKTELLRQLLEQDGFRVRKLRVVFDWKDLPLPWQIHNVLKNQTLWDNDILTVQRTDGLWIKVDCSWHPGLEAVGFPVTRRWDGLSDTLQITSGSLQFFDAKSYKRKFSLHPETAQRFAEKFNKWMVELFTQQQLRHPPKIIQELQLL